jgi:transcriptional regulator of NAD metabolism
LGQQIIRQNIAILLDGKCQNYGFLEGYLTLSINFFSVQDFSVMSDEEEEEQQQLLRGESEEHKS